MRLAWFLPIVLVLSTTLAAAGERSVPLQGTRNTRDLGGLPAREGRVRAGLVYRSGALCFATDADVERLAELRLATLIELRAESEITRDGPDRAALTDRVPHRVWLPMVNRRGNGAQAYAGYLEENPRAIRDFFALLADPDSYPLLFHCSAGKDRTGILSALVLLTLGTPRDAIMDDYLQSERNSPSLVVHPEWLEVVFGAVDAAGGIEPFLAAYEVGPEGLSRIRRILVEPNPERH